MNADTEFQRRLEQFLDEKYASERNHLAQGICLNYPDPQADYAQRTGYLRALTHIGEECKEIAKQMQGINTQNRNGEI